MILPGDTFRRVLDLPKVDWTNISAQKQQQVVARCQELLKQLPMITEIEGVKKFKGGLYYFEKALTDTLENLGATVDEETAAELLVENFLR